MGTRCSCTDGSVDNRNVWAHSGGLFHMGAGPRVARLPRCWPCGRADTGFLGLRRHSALGPVCQSAGPALFRAIGGFRDRVPAYRPGSETTECDVVVGEAITARQEGAFGYCLQAVCADATVDLLHALRREVGPEFRILCDGGQRFDLEGALQIGRALEAIDGHWFAEPLRDETSPDCSSCPMRCRYRWWPAPLWETLS